MKTDSKISIKRARESDVDKFYPFFEKSVKTQFPPYSNLITDYFLEEEYPKDYLKESIRNKNKFLYIANVDKQIAGYLLTNKNYGGISYATWFAVFPKFQKKGIASSLLLEWEKDVAKHGGHKLYLWTVKRNLEFYKKRGFTQGGFIPDAWFGKTTRYMFYKTLAKSDEKKFLKEFIKKKKGR